jgi:Txe/YoeB family toxin of toxin-antitoxin system
MPEAEPWRVTFHKQARKDAVLLERAGLREKADALIEVLRRDPFANPPAYEKLVGDMAGAYSRRLTIQHRIVYFVIQESREVRVLRMWTHYG